MDATELFVSSRIVPVVAIGDESVAVDLAISLRDAGIKALEVTLRTAAALRAIELIASRVPDIIVGAGSVRRPDQFPEIVERGARFAVSPGSSDSLIAKAKESKMPFIPGAVTATEILVLMERGYSLQKFFPAELSGGVAKLKALSAPLPEVRFFPTGGIDNTLISEYLSLECVNCVGGSWFVPIALLAEKNFTRIRELTVQAIQHSHE